MHCLAGGKGILFADTRGERKCDCLHLHCDCIVILVSATIASFAAWPLMVCTQFTGYTFFLGGGAVLLRTRHGLCSEAPFLRGGAVPLRILLGGNHFLLSIPRARQGHAQRVGDMCWPRHMCVSWPSLHTAFTWSSWANFSSRFTVGLMFVRWLVMLQLFASFGFMHAIATIAQYYKSTEHDIVLQNKT